MNSVNGTAVKYLKNSHSSYLLQVHIIFVTKYRELHSGAQVTLLAQLAVHQYRFLSNTSSSKIDLIRLLRNLGYPSRAASCGAFRRFWVRTSALKASDLILNAKSHVALPSESTRFTNDISFKPKDLFTVLRNSSIRSSWVRKYSGGISPTLFCIGKPYCFDGFIIAKPIVNHNKKIRN